MKDQSSTVGDRVGSGAAIEDVLNELMIIAASSTPSCGTSTRTIPLR